LRSRLRLKPKRRSKLRLKFHVLSPSIAQNLLKIRFSIPPTSQNSSDKELKLVEEPDTSEKQLEFSTMTRKSPLKLRSPSQRDTLSTSPKNI